jgi:purine-nucleoside phosphorylase
MKERLTKIMDAMHKYNSSDLAYQVFGFNKDITYDALVVAPSFDPLKLKVDEYAEVIITAQRQYISGAIVKYKGLNIAWIKVSSSASNTIDHLLICSELKFKKLIFVGAVGALKKEFELGDLCTPSYSIAGDNAHTYLKESIKDYVPFEKIVPPNQDFIDKVITNANKKNINLKKASVFCTPSISCEYIHLDEIKEFNTDLIEMETASFYLVGELLEIPCIALLIVSDNSASNVSLIGRTKEQQDHYNDIRFKKLPELIFDIAEMK